MRELRQIEAVSLVAGAGIGGGVMALPYLAAEVGFWPAAAIMLLAFIVSVLLHIMVGELSMQTEYSSELLTIFSRHLFEGKKALRAAFYLLMALTLICNLAAYISGAGDILADLLGLPALIGQLLFFVLAAAVVLLGLKSVAINETLTLTIMLVIIGSLAVATLLLPSHQALASPSLGLSPLLAVYGMAMFSLSALFSVPQAASGLRHDTKRLPAAIGLGLLVNLAVMLAVTYCTLVGSETVTEVAIIGWAAALGGPARLVGSLFIALAMLTTFWSISLQLSDMSREFLGAGRFVAWLIATLPSLVLAILPLTGFLDLMQLAGGATAVVVAVMAVPAYRNATRGLDRLLLGQHGNSLLICVPVALMYLLMAIASFL